jgi:putative NADH-flavin reductase
MIGATGQTGRVVLTHLLERGHEVTAFTRRPTAVVQVDQQLHVVQGDTGDAASLHRAVAGREAVMSTFGPRTLAKTEAQEIFMRNLINAMQKGGVRRLVNLSAWGSGGAAVPPRNPIARYLLIPFLLRNLLADKYRGERYLFASDLDYTNVCPARIVDRPARGHVRASIDGAGLEQLMHREDLASFMVDQLTSDEWLRKCVAIGY